MTTTKNIRDLFVQAFEEKEYKITQKGLVQFDLLHKSNSNAS